MLGIFLAQCLILRKYPEVGYDGNIPCVEILGSYLKSWEWMSLPRERIKRKKEKSPRLSFGELQLY